MNPTTLKRRMATAGFVQKPVPMKLIQPAPAPSETADQSPVLAPEAAYREERDQLLSEIPAEFHKFAASYAWEQGHSAGYSEVLGHLRDLVSGIRESIAAYDRRVSRP